MNKNDQEFLVQKRPANVFAYIFGSIGAIIMGSGMSLVMTEIGSMIGIKDTMVPGILIGIVGMFMAIINYPIMQLLRCQIPDAEYRRKLAHIFSKNFIRATHHILCKEMVWG